MIKYTSEAVFEEDVISVLQTKGWEGGVIRYPTEQTLLKNWADILYKNNNTSDRLNGCPLTDSEMAQIIEQINALATPLKLNGFINGKTVAIKRDNVDDTAHFGKEISLKIYDRREIAGGQSVYQIAQQPKFNAADRVFPKRRGDIMLLINGMPVIHIELKKSDIDVTQAANQIEKYSKEGIFTGIFALVQVFVAMTPEETLYFANPGTFTASTKQYYFHWADFDNHPINEWNKVIEGLLSIPMAHEIVGYYTVADNADGILKVMRSYQYYASREIWKAVAKHIWGTKDQLGGHVWHTTGSGKTLTSFKSAQLIANAKVKIGEDAKGYPIYDIERNECDKVVFLIDRIELGIQSLKEYRSFAEVTEDVQETEDTYTLVNKLKSNSPSDTMIVTSIQKMSNINEDYKKMGGSDLDKINSKRIVFIVDECHRSTFGDMLLTIKETFPYALFFGFTGTPIHEENRKKGTTTKDIFGSELHRYSITDGINDGNVLGFDTVMVTTFDDDDLRKAVALEAAKADTVTEAMNDPAKKKTFSKYMDAKQVPMAGYTTDDGKYVKGIEDLIPEVQYMGHDPYDPEEPSGHQIAVVDDIGKNWDILSQGSKFHAIFATHSIPEAIGYYKLFRVRVPSMRVAALFDPSDDNNNADRSIMKHKGIAQMLDDYNAMYGHNFTIQSYDRYKKDVTARLAHKSPYERVAKEKQLDLLIVVDQVLTGFDSKWVNTLYLDKMREYEGLIQAFSRTNRLFGDDKPFGTIKYYRRPYTMKRNIEAAFDLYAGEMPFGLFVDKLPDNVEKMSAIYKEICDLFENAGVDNFEKLPKEQEEKAKFAKLWKQFNNVLEGARIQGFKFDTIYTVKDTGEVIELPDEETYDILMQRYRELFVTGPGPGPEPDSEIPYEIDVNLAKKGSDRIDKDYMNLRYKKWCKLREENADPAEIDKALNELHKSFAALTQEEQKFANIFLHEVQSGDIVPDGEKSFRDYISEHINRAKDREIRTFCDTFGLDEAKLRERLDAHPNEHTIDEFGRFEALKNTADRTRAKAYFEQKEGHAIIPPKVMPKLDALLREFIFKGGFDITGTDDVSE